MKEKLGRFEIHLPVSERKRLSDLRVNLGLSSMSETLRVCIKKILDERFLADVYKLTSLDGKVSYVVVRGGIPFTAEPPVEYFGQIDLRKYSRRTIGARSMPMTFTDFEYLVNQGLIPKYHLPRIVEKQMKEKYRGENRGVGK